MMGRASWAFGTVLVLFAAGCGDSGGSGSGGSGGMGAMGGGGATATGGAGGTTGGAGGATGGGGTGGATGAPLAPTIQSVEPLEGALHVAWTNNTPDCDKIELDRKKDDGAYAKVYTLTGSATSQHDSQAVAPGTYCYKARCLKGADSSPDSNEKCGTP